jgi:hypothetical protein
MVQRSVAPFYRKSTLLVFLETDSTGGAVEIIAGCTLDAFTTKR